MTTRLCISVLTFVLGILLFSCERPDDRVIIDIDEFSTEDHQIIGATINQQIKNLPDVFPVLDRETYKPAYDYVGTLLQTLKLTAVVKNRKVFDWDITILQDDEIRTSFASSNGHIYIYTGLLKFLKSENELVAVLGNEIAYADKGFVTETLQEVHGKRLMSDIILKKEVAELPQVVAGIPMLTFDKEVVLEADQFTIDLICPFEYDAKGLETFLDKANSAQIQWVNSKYGDRSERIRRVIELASDCGEEGVTNENQYQRFLKNYLP